MTARAFFAALVPLAVVLAAAGAVESPDHTAHRVLALVDGIPWIYRLSPVFMEEPIGAWSARPGSVVLLSIHLLFFGADEVVPSWALFVRGFVTLLFFGGAARAWLRVFGLSAVAAPAALASCALQPVLFSAWQTPEFDTLGAAGTLAGCALLARAGPLGARWVVVVPALALGLFLKESSGLVTFALLGAGLLAVRDRPERWRFVGVIAAGVVLWAFEVQPMLRDTESSMAGVGLLERLPLLEHVAGQGLYLTGAAGALAVLVGALPRPQITGWVAVGVALALPIFAFYNHYETVYATDRHAAWVAGGALWVGLLLRAREPAAQAILLAFGGLGAVTLAAPTAREDLAARLFVAVAPLLLALALDGARRTHRIPRAALMVGVAWYAGASAFSFSGYWRALATIEAEGRSALARALEPETVVVFSFYTQLMGWQELRTQGVDLRGEVDFVWLPSQVRGGFPPVEGERGRLDLDGCIEQGVSTWAYWLAPRSEMSAQANAALIGDLSWLRRDLRIFTPLDHLIRNPGGLEIPPLTTFEDLRATVYDDQDAPLLVLLRTKALESHAREAQWKELPRDLFSTPRRLLAGIPLIESYRLEHERIRLARGSTDRSACLAP